MMAVISACSALAHAMNAIVSMPGSDIYKESTTSYFTALENEVSPACVVKPASTNDVVEVLKTIKPFVEKGECQFAVRARGNQPFAGAANIAGGITIDLRSIEEIDIHPQTSSVTVGAGASWGDVYAKLAAADLAVAGGRSSQGGIGGLTLGGREAGGFSFHSTRRGWVSDNVLRMQVVLASGKIVYASAHENADLFTALKGGSNNLGIVTAFEFATFEQGKMWGGDVVYSADLFSQQLQDLANYAADPKSDQDVHLIVSIAYAAIFGATICKNSAYHTNATSEPESLKAFTPAQAQFDSFRTLRTDTVKGFADEQTKGSPPGQRTIYLTTTIKSNTDLMNQITTQFTSSIDSLKPIKGLVYSLSFQPITPALINNSRLRGPNSFGLDPMDGPMMNVLILASWAEKTDDTTIEQAGLAFIKQIDDLARKGKLNVAYKMLTYAYPGEDVIRSYGKMSENALKSVSKKYDPEGVFQKAVPGGFKLFPGNQKLTAVS